MNKQTMRVIKRVTGRTVVLAGNAEAQSLADAPLPEKPVTLEVTLLANGCDGYLMRFAAQDGPIAGSSWHASLAEAELRANQLFGLKRSDWKNEPPAVSVAPPRGTNSNAPRNVPQRKPR